uniref:Hypothetical_protein n=1 Tax=Oryza glaberrima TaxID=4538 RepID=G2XMP3_ORYGL|nr:hypothetical_protein [Oryza glaberrima]
MAMDSYYYSMLFVLPPILYMSYHLTRILADKKKPTTHGLKAHPLLGHLPAFVNNSNRFLDWTTELIVGSPEMRMGFWIPGMRTGIITGNPADVEHILRTNFANYPKGEHAIGMLEDFLGHGLFNSDGEQWLWQRKNASYEFSKRSLRRFVVDIVQAEVADRFLPLLRRAASDGGGDGDVVVLDLQKVLQRFGFDTICMVAFGHDPRCLPTAGGTLVRAGWSVTYSAYAMGRLAAIWGEDCLEYRPERWLGDDGAFQPASPFRFTVFHAGPRMCLGKEMAYVQMKSIVANVLEEFEVDVVKEVAGGGVPEHVLSVTLRMKGGLPVKIRRKTEAY